ncbi:MAG: hypothetical protein MI743_09130 [Sneathiellales bacterium]|nr:hypothetical protein [Sneathiellales bacterium]
MNRFGRFALGASSALAGLGLLASQAVAIEGSSSLVKKVDMDFSGYAAVINIYNGASNKHISKLDLKVQQSKIDVEIDGLVQCAQDKDIHFSRAKAYFGKVVIDGQGTINDIPSLYGDGIDVAKKTWSAGFWIKNQWVTEGLPGPETFSVPLNAVKSGGASFRLNPLEELAKELQKHMNGGGTALDFYKNKQEIVVKRPISLAGWCRKGNSEKGGFETKDFTIQIKYAGDPALTNKAQLSGQLGNGNLPGQFNAGEQAFKLLSADFMANIPHKYGKCIPNTNPKIRFNYKVAGTKLGRIDFRIRSASVDYNYSGNYYQKNAVIHDPKAGSVYNIDFDFPLKQILSKPNYSFMTIHNNKTYHHNMVLQARYKQVDGEKTEWKDMDTAVFKHRCVPQANVPMAGGVKKYDDKNGGSKMGKRAPTKPVVKPLVKKPVPAKPKPARAKTN